MTLLFADNVTRFCFNGVALLQLLLYFTRFYVKIEEEEVN